MCTGAGAQASSLAVAYFVPPPSAQALRSVSSFTVFLDTLPALPADVPVVGATAEGARRGKL